MLAACPSMPSTWLWASRWPFLGSRLTWQKASCMRCPRCIFISERLLHIKHPASNLAACILIHPLQLMLVLACPLCRHRHLCWLCALRGILSK